jgi:pyrroline-5-carboxylate reductase
LALKTKFPPEELIKQIASKGGTTEAGLEVLRKGGSLEEAVKAAKKRSEELSRKE